MKNYEAIKLENSQYDYLVIATTSSKSPIIMFLHSKLVPFLEHGKIVFDLTAIHGKCGRYAFATVKNHELVSPSITSSESIDDDIAEVSKTFFANHLDVIERAALPKILKHTLIEEFTR